MTIDTRQQLLGTINSQIKLNGTGAITGPILNNVLDTMVNSALFQTGAWSQYTSYAPLDVVEYLGNAYVANVANVNIIPSTDPSTWTPFSSASAVAGLSGYVQYNNGTGGLAASSNLTFDGTNLNASVTATGATTSRTLANLFGDYVSVKDFGAVGDGTTNDTAAFTAAAATGQPYYVPYTSNYYNLTSNPTGSLFGPGTIKISGITFNIPGSLVPNNAVTMVNTITNGWMVLQPNGTPLNISGSTTSGLQEAINYATTYGYNLFVYGSPGVGSPGSEKSIINCSTTVAWPPLRGMTVKMYGVHIIFSSAVTGNGMYFNSMDEVDIDIIGEIVYQGNTYALIFNPVNPIPVDTGTFIDATNFHISAVVTNGGSPIGCVQFSTSTASIATMRLEIDEINGAGAIGASATALYGVIISNPSSNTAFEQNIITLGHVHGIKNAGVQIGTISTNQTNNRQNVWTIGSIKPAGVSSSGLNTFGSNDVFNIGGITSEEGTLVTGIVLQPGAINNAITVGGILGATTKLNDQGTNNVVTGSNARGTNTFGTNKGVIYNPDGTIYQYINNAQASSGGTTTTWQVTFPNTLLTCVSSPENQVTGVQTAGTTTGVTLTVGSGTPTCYVWALGR